MRGYALSSAVPEAPITDAIGSALVANLRRLEQWWRMHLNPEWDNLVNVALEYCTETGAVPSDPTYAVVQVVASLPDAPGDIAYHTLDASGRPLCLISWAAVQTEGGTLTGPNGLVSAISHEILESRVDPLCAWTVKQYTGELNPDGVDEPIEVCDRVQGSDYEEPCAPGIFVANAVGPRFWIAGQVGLLDIRSDVTTAAVTSAFEQLPGGYHEAIAANGAVTQVFGDAVSAMKRARLLRTGVRGGMRHD